MPDKANLSDSCVDLYIWHDGEFPFSEEDDGRPPYLVHHCDITQFIRFGRALAGLMGMEEE